MTKKDESVVSSIKCCIYDNILVKGDFKVRDHCHLTFKYRGAAHRNCNINISLNQKLPIILQNLGKL